MIVTHVTHEVLLEAAVRFEQQVPQTDFTREKALTCRDMAAKLQMYGSWKSIKQQDYARRLVEWSTPKVAPTAIPPAAQLAETPGVARVTQLFDTARHNGLRKAQIDVVVSLGEDVVPLTLKPAKSEALGGRNPGAIYVKCGATDVYLGKIMRDGQFFRSKDCGDDELKALMAFAKDPVGISRASGKLTSNCCFCRKSLTTPESVAVGYGPTCAKSYGLPWGDDLVLVDVPLK